MTRCAQAVVFLPQAHAVMYGPRAQRDWVALAFEEVSLNESHRFHIGTPRAARRRAPLAAVFALAAVAGVLGSAERAEALPLLTLSGSLRGLYGSPVDGDLDPSPYGAGIGLRAGVTLPASLYLGGSLDYFFGESVDTPLGEVSVSLLQLMAHGAYDLGLGPLTVRPGLGLGLASTSGDFPGGASESESDFVVSPGVEASIGLGLLSVGAEARYNKIFSDGDVSTDAIVFGVGIGVSL